MEYMGWWYRLRAWKGWVFVLFVLGLIGALFIAAARMFVPKRVVRESKRVPVPVPETDHVEKYHEAAEANRRAADHRDRDPDRLSAKIREFQARSRRGK